MNLSYLASVARLDNATNSKIDDPFTWYWQHFVLIWAFHLLAVEVLANGIILNMGALTPLRIAKLGHHLDKLETKDKACIAFNRLTIPTMTYTLLYFCWTRPVWVKWNPEDLTIFNTLGSLIAYFAIYDFFYTLFHRFLHIRALYPWVHKHHHRQHAPSRGNLDAVNVHPFEFVTGEFLHVVSVMLCPGHVYTVLIFMIIGGILASLNHTRFDIRLSSLYQVRYHDIHHRLPQTNYGQYTMYWDKIMGSFRDYDDSAKLRKATAAVAEETDASPSIKTE